METRLLLLLLLLLLLSILSLSLPQAFTPSTAIYLDCGSSSTITISTDNPPRDFKPDSSFLTSSSSTSVTNPNNSSASSPLYSTARVFTQTSSYNFPITTNGTYFLRLHFFPFSADNNNLSTANFNVSALQKNLLLGNFSPSTAAPPIVKEFLFWMDGGDFELSFSPNSNSNPLAFVNAIEVFTAPPEILIDQPQPKNVLPPGVGAGVDQISRQALETVHRINVGGWLITPTNDTLWRTWIPDDNFLLNPSMSLKNSTNRNIVYGTDSWRTREIAPDSVYNTARSMNISPETKFRNPNFNFNVTWSFPVEPGYKYFLRMHFCNFITSAVNDLIFDVYIGDLAAEKGLFLGSLTYQVPSAAYYCDFVTEPEAGVVKVGIGQSSQSDQWHANAILNGLEIMKINSFSTFSSYDKNKNKKTNNIFVICGSVVGGILLIAALISAYAMICRTRKLKKPTPESKRTPLPLSPSPDVLSSSINKSGAGGTHLVSPKVDLELYIPFASIKLATNDFDEALVIGSGGFGQVYKGVLPDGTKVAIKRASRESRQGYSEFQNEITVLSQIRHRHLVSLIGYCDKMSEMILVYEFMEKGTLESYLYGSDLPCLSWQQRLQICIAAGRGLHYLHTGHSQVIIHRDVKSTNILLGENFLAKVSDFGISKFGPSVGETHVRTGVKGSFGYIDPEYFKMVKLTIKSDVYSFGVLLFEVLCARPVIDRMLSREELNLAEWALHWQRKGQLEKIIDQRLVGKINPNSLRKFGETAESCLAEYGVDRPTMADVLWNLEYALQLQETELRREPHEDSGNVDPRIQLVAMRQMPSTVTTVDEDNEEKRSSPELDITTSNAISQFD